MREEREKMRTEEIGNKGKRRGQREEENERRMKEREEGVGNEERDGNLGDRNNYDHSRHQENYSALEVRNRSAEREREREREREL